MKNLNQSGKSLKIEEETHLEPMFSDSGILFKTEFIQKSQQNNRVTSVRFSKMIDDEDKISKTQDIQKRSGRLKMRKRLKLNIKKSIGTIQEIPTGLVETQEVGRMGER